MCIMYIMQSTCTIYSISDVIVNVDEILTYMYINAYYPEDNYCLNNVYYMYM